jgi:hypothetical protein
MTEHPQFIATLETWGLSLGQFLEFVDSGDEITRDHVEPGTWDGITRDLKLLKRGKPVEYDDVARVALSIQQGLIPVGDLTAENIPPPDCLVESMLYADSLVAFVAGSKMGKTFTLLDMACLWSAGLPWLNFEPLRPLSILYIDGEMPAWSLAHRMKLVMNGRGFAPGTACNIVFSPLCGKKVTLSTMLEVVKRYGPGVMCQGTKPDIVILDNLSAFAPKEKDWYSSESDDRTMAIMCDICAEIRQAFGCAMILTHHATKGRQDTKEIIDMGGGSGVLARRVDGVLAIRDHISGKDEDGTDHRQRKVETTMRHFKGVSIPVVREHALYDIDSLAGIDISGFVDRHRAKNGSPAKAADLDKINTLDEVRAAFMGRSAASISSLADGIRGRREMRLQWLYRLVQDGVLQEAGEAKSVSGSTYKLYTMPPSQRKELDLGVGRDAQSL